MPISQLPRVPPDAVEAEHRNEQVAQIRDYYGQLARVENIGFHLRVANAEFCKAIAAQLGMHAATVESLPRKYRSYSNEALGVSWTKPTVISVAEGSPAAAAGIGNGDRILRLNDEPVPPTRTARWIDDYLKKNGVKPVRVALERDGKDRTVTVQPIMACSVPIVLATDQQPNAFAGRDKITIQSGILRAASTDATLAVVVGHELAHVNLGHYDKRLQNAVLGALGGALVDGGFLLGGMYTRGAFTRHFMRAGALAFSVGFEREADYFGCYYAARAGYDVSGASDFWRKMALENPNSIRLATTHPTSPERFVLMRQTIAEIEDKRRRHLPLVPELKPSAIETAPEAAREFNY
jgi:predicted Zn-dependent protease